MRSDCYTDDVMAEVVRDPANFSPPGGESMRDVEGRMTGFIHTQVLPRIQRDGRPGVIVSHGLAIKWSVIARWPTRLMKPVDG